MVTYLADTDTYQFWNGSAWTNLVSGSGLNHISTVTGTGVASISVNNVFSSLYRNYRVLIATSTSGSAPVRMRLRAAGVDNTSANYFSVASGRDGSSVDKTLNENSGTSGLLSRTVASTHKFTLDIFDPFVAADTVVIGQSLTNQNTDFLQGGFTIGAACDGFTLLATTGNLNDTRIQTFGYKD
jgi:hypothetical protein